MSSVWGQLLDQILFVKGMYYGSFHDKYKATLLPCHFGKISLDRIGYGYLCLLQLLVHISEHTHITFAHIFYKKYNKLIMISLLPA